MKIIHFLPDLNGNSGVAEFGVELCNALCMLGHDVSIAYLCDHEKVPGPDVHLINMKKGYWGLKFDSEVAHVHGVWMKCSVQAMVMCLVRRIPYVFSPHGGLMPRVFTKGRVKKLLVWHFLLKPLMRRAAAIHCTSEAEREACEKLGVKGPYVIAPLGVHLPERESKSKCEVEGGEKSKCEVEVEGGEKPVDADVPDASKSNPHRTVLFLGRLSEEKGLENLLEAWHQLQQEKKIGQENRSTEDGSRSSVDAFVSNASPGIDSKLILAGPDWGDYKSVLDVKIAAERIEGVEFTGAVQGEAKDRLYREADIFVLPSPMENFSMVVLEALAYGVPVIATKGTPWAELEGSKVEVGSPSPSKEEPTSTSTSHLDSAASTGRCGYWIDQGVVSLKDALFKLLSLPSSELRRMGARGRSLASRKYRWTAIAQILTECYKEAVK